MSWEVEHSVHSAAPSAVWVLWAALEALAGLERADP